jgi:hypothetical protein
MSQSFPPTSEEQRSSPQRTSDALKKEAIKAGTRFRNTKTNIYG